MTMKQPLVNSLQIVFICTLGLLFGMIQGEAVLFDLGGVLVDTNKVAAFREIGLTNLVKYVIKEKKVRGIGQHLRDRLFKFLETIQARKLDCPQAYDEKGRLLPQAMCNWLSGATKPQDCLRLIDCKADSNPDFFTSPAEKTVLLAIAHMMFSPERFTKTRAVNRAGLDFVQACKDGGHTVYILSNWEQESFALLKKTYPEFEELFDGYITSGEAGYIKPDAEIYTQLLKKYCLDPHQCIFLDDRQENLDEAAKLGIAGILCTTDKIKTFDSLYDEFDSWIDSRQSVLV